MISKELTLAQYINLRLKELEVSYVFGVPGSYIMPIWQLCQTEPKAILARHESGAAFMAQGFARASGKPGFLLTTIGPGVTNALTGVADAYRDTVPLFFISGQSTPELFGKGVFQETSGLQGSFHPCELMRHVCKKSVEALSAEDGAEKFEQLYRLCLEGKPGPVHLSVPVNVQNQKISSKFIENIKSTTAKCSETKLLTSSLPLIPSRCTQIVEQLKKRQRPLFLIGWGVHLANLAPDISNFANQLKIPIISSPKGLACTSLMSQTFLGHIGPGEKKETIRRVKEYNPDIILVLGASLSEYYLRSLSSEFHQAFVVQIDIDETIQAFRSHLVDLFVHEDLKQIWHAFVRSWHIENTNFLSFQKVNLEYPKVLCNLNSDPSCYLASAIQYLEEILPEESILLPDAGNHWLNSLTLYRPRKFGSFFVSLGLATMGFAVCASIGIKLANPDAFVICITGDASILMSGNEVTVAKELGLNILFIVMNNGSHGRIRTAQQLDFQNNIVATDVLPVDFALWANSYFIPSVKVTNLEEFKEAILIAIQKKSLSLIDVVLNKDEFPVCLEKGVQ